MHFSFCICEIISGEYTENPQIFNDVCDSIFGSMKTCYVTFFFIQLNISLSAYTFLFISFQLSVTSLNSEVTEAIIANYTSHKNHTLIKIPVKTLGTPFLGLQADRLSP